MDLKQLKIASKLLEKLDGIDKEIIEIDKMDYVRNNPGPTGVDYRQITLLQAEMAKKIAAACN